MPGSGGQAAQSSMFGDAGSWELGYAITPATVCVPHNDTVVRSSPVTTVFAIFIQTIFTKTE